MRRLQTKNMEDIFIQYFQADQQGNVSVVSEAIEIPLNTGMFAAAAAKKGLMIDFVSLVEGDTEAAKALIAQCQAQLDQYKEIVKKITEAKRLAEQAKVAAAAASESALGAAIPLASKAKTVSAQGGVKAAGAPAKDEGKDTQPAGGKPPAVNGAK